MTAAKIAVQDPAPEPTPAPPTCRSCVFWLERAHIPSKDGLGACRRYPAPTGSMMGGAQFPLHRGTDWCGEYKEREISA
jgi:hypothetical protein